MEDDSFSDTFYSQREIFFPPFSNLTVQYIRFLLVGKVDTSEGGVGKRPLPPRTNRTLGTWGILSLSYRGHNDMVVVVRTWWN